MTLHVMPGTQNDQVLDLFQSCHDAGQAVRGVLLAKMGWSSELRVADIRRVSPGTEVMCRWYARDWDDEGQRINFDVTTRDDGRAFARRFFDRFGDADTLAADFVQIVNEPGYGPGSAAWWHGALDVADEHDVKLAVGCWAVYHPPYPGEMESGALRRYHDFWRWPGMNDLVRRVKAEGHALALHEYQWPDEGDIRPAAEAWTDRENALRHQKVTQALDSDLRDVPIRVLEFGTGYAAERSTEWLMAGMQAADSAMRGDNVVWAALWSDGGGGGWTRSQLGKHRGAIKSYLLGR